MQGDDEELTKAMDEEVARLLTATPQLVTDFQTTFGSADTLLAQQWISHGLTPHSDQVSTTVQSAQTFTDEEDEVLDEGRAWDDETPATPVKTVKDLPQGTRVIVVNRMQSYYGAVGTVVRRVDDKLVSVEFDLKPNRPYDVPVADLDIHRGGNEVSALLKTEDGLWTFNGVPSVVEFLRSKEADNGPWAFTGSVALSYWAREYDVPFRSPKDMDIVVSNLNGWYYDFGLAVWGRPGEPTAQGDHKTIQLNMGKLDILADGKGLAELGDGPHQVGGVNVVSLRTIGAYKEKRGEAKDLEDLKVVAQLILLHEQREK